MKSFVYKLKFPNGIHIGTGRLSSSAVTIHADTLFSAICIEALNIGGEEMLSQTVNAAKAGKFLFSDAFPYIGDTLYFPKPVCRINADAENTELKKEFKNLTYIPYTEVPEYMVGKSDPVSLNKVFSRLGNKELHQKVFLKPEDDNELYSVGVYKFADGNGLYVIVFVSDEDTEKMLDSIFESLSFSGIGGKRKSGYGRFEYEKRPFDMPDSPNGKYMTLTTCMSSYEDLEAVLVSASYKLIKRSGFVQSDTYSDTDLKKHDFYMFDAGSVFAERFEGDIFDVSIDGNHPVYKYAKPVFVRIGGAV